MKEYVGNSIKIESENTEVEHQQECDEVNASHNRLGFGFEIELEDALNNPGLRRVSKICSNSLWEQLGQRCGMNEYEIIFDSTLQFVNSSTISKPWTQHGTSSVKTALNYATKRERRCSLKANILMKSLHC